MSALCAFPPLIPAAGAVYSAGYMADVSASSSRIGWPSQQQQQHQQQQHQQQQQQSQSRLVPAYGSTFTAFHHHHPTTNVAAAKMMMTTTTKITQQPESAWSSRSAAALNGSEVPPAAKRRCTDKARSSTSSTGWVEQQAQSLWPSSSTSTCPSGCTMCHIQQQQQQQVYSHQGSGFVAATAQFDARRPLQEKHQNREDIVLLQNNNNNNNSSLSQSLKTKATQSRLASLSNRTLAVDPKKDYSTPLHVDCSVEYDLPRIVRPPPGAQPLLILAPPRQSTATPSSTAGYPSSWTNARPLPPQWSQAPSSAGSNRVKASEKPQQQTVKSQVVQQQQQAKLASGKSHYFSPRLKCSERVSGDAQSHFLFASPVVSINDAPSVRVVG